MSRQCETKLVFIDAASIITYANELLPTGYDIYVHAQRAGIQAVLDQFLDDRCGPLHHLAGSDLVNQMVRKLQDGHAMLACARKRPTIFSKRRAKVLLEFFQVPGKSGIDSVWPTRMLSLLRRFAERMAAVLTL